MQYYIRRNYLLIYLNETCSTRWKTCLQKARHKANGNKKLTPPKEKYRLVNFFGNMCRKKLRDNLQGKLPGGTALK